MVRGRAGARATGAPRRKAGPGSRHVLGGHAVVVLVCTGQILGQVSGESATRPATETATQPAAVPGLDPAFRLESIKLPSGDEHKYALYLPAQYDADPRHHWPVIVTLHGSGEMGTNGTAPTVVGLPVYIAANPTKFPFVTIIPQARTMWWGDEDALVVFAILEHVLREYRTDRDRVYLTGFSMGGFGTWELAVARPDVFAALIPICGKVQFDPEMLVNIRHLPIWAFHGRLDKHVPVSGSREAIEALKKLGANPKYDEYEFDDHYCWDETYANRDLWHWLLKPPLKRKPAPRVIEYVMPGRFARVWWLGLQAEAVVTAPARMRAEIGTGGAIAIESQRVADCSISPSPGLLEAGSEIRVIWNGREVFRGKMAEPELILTPNGVAPAATIRPGE